MPPSPGYEFEPHTRGARNSADLVSLTGTLISASASTPEVISTGAISKWPFIQVKSGIVDIWSTKFKKPSSAGPVSLIDGTLAGTKSVDRD